MKESLSKQNYIRCLTRSSIKGPILVGAKYPKVFIDYPTILTREDYLSITSLLELADITSITLASGETFDFETKQWLAASQPQTEEILQQRGSRYGTFPSHAHITQAIKEDMRCSPNWKNGNLKPDHMEALDMIAHKIGRILNGDPDYDDSWIDIAGYATLVAKRINNQPI